MSDRKSRTVTLHKVKAFELPCAEEGLRSVTVRLVEIKPADGAIFIYGAPYYRMPVRLDLKKPESEVQTNKKRVFIQLVNGAKWYHVEFRWEENEQQHAPSPICASCTSMPWEPCACYPTPESGIRALRIKIVPDE